MKKVHNKLWTVVAATAVGAVMLRMFKLAYSRTRLRQIYQVAVGGDERTVKLGQALINSLPQTSFDFRGRTTEPINFLFIGSADQLRLGFGSTGWLQAEPINASNRAKAFWTGLRHGSHPDAPMTPYYISTTPQDMSLQKETPRRSAHERHHIRLWRTNLHLADTTELWLGMSSFDSGLKLINGWHFPYHHIDPNLDAEREFIIRDLLSVGAREHKRYRLSDELRGVNDHKEPFYTDGKIVVVDVRGVKA